MLWATVVSVVRVTIAGRTELEAAVEHCRLDKLVCDGLLAVIAQYGLDVLPCLDAVDVLHVEKQTSLTLWGEFKRDVIPCNCYRVRHLQAARARRLPAAVVFHLHPNGIAAHVVYLRLHGPTHAHGIQASKDVKLSNISRSLNESIALIKTENRLSRNLASEDLSARINRWICWEGAGWVDEDTVLAVDLSDLRKNFAKKMENLAKVRDGSTGQIVDGY